MAVWCLMMTTNTAEKMHRAFHAWENRTQFKDAETVAEFKARVFGDQMGEGKKASEPPPLQHPRALPVS